MPVYEFECKKCKEIFEVTMSIADSEKKKPACPKCKGKQVRQLLSTFSAKTSRKS
ncbi:MAG: zinc ribbon domain-containing protein [bacterium]|nr:MAG: zinc ribbon domain-containing protein [bacterium]